MIPRRWNRRRFYFARMCALSVALAWAPSVWGGESATNRPFILGIPLYSEDSRPEPEFVAMLNAYLSEDDIVFVRKSPTVLALLKDVQKARVSIIRQSFAALQDDLLYLKSNGVRVDYVCYNPEGWRTSHTSPEELEDLEAAVKKVRGFADEHGARLIVVPDHTVFEANPRIAAGSGIFAYQFQRWQLLGDLEFRTKVQEITARIRRENPGIRIIAQLSTNPPTGGREEDGSKELMPVSADQILSKVQSIRDLVDGVGFLVFGEGDGHRRLQEFLAKFRATR